MRSVETWTEQRLEKVYCKTFGLTAPLNDRVSGDRRMSRLTRAIFTGVALEGSVMQARRDNQRAMR